MKMKRQGGQERTGEKEGEGERKQGKKGVTEGRNYRIEEEWREEIKGGVEKERMEGGKQVRGMSEEEKKERRR